MEQRLIDANALKEKISSLAITVTGIRAGKDILRDILLEYRLTVLRMIEEQPTVDAVEVVRCKDCLHSRELNKYENQLYLDECVGCTYHSLSYHDSIMTGDDFCSYGERRDSDG